MHKSPGHKSQAQEAGVVQSVVRRGDAIMPTVGTAREAEVPPGAPRWSAVKSLGRLLAES